MRWTEWVDEASELAILALVMHALVVIGVAMRVILRRRPAGVTLSWLALVLVAPFIGVLLYLFLGERRIGEKRKAAVAKIMPEFQRWLAQLLESSPVAEGASLQPEQLPLHRLARGTVGIPALRGNRLQLMSDTHEVLHSIAADIDAAKSTVHMEFYIWHEGGDADDVVEAVLRAQKRGVRCRVLLDGLGSASFLVGSRAKRMREAGVELITALPVGLFRALMRRTDHRLHRKIVVLDGELAYTGSLNLVDPRNFKQGGEVGEWIDTMVRMEGPAVEALAATFVMDWMMESGQSLQDLRGTIDVKVLPTVGTTRVQVVPSGPGYNEDAIHQLLLTAIYASRVELTLTTPYFVPDDAIVSALISAARRGVDVTLIMPRKNDSFLVHWASRSYFDALLDAGVKIARFTGGLLHSKIIAIDGRTGIFGSVNLDQRSFWLNFEISLFIYDSDFVGRLKDLLRGYLSESELVDLDTWRERRFSARLLEGVAQLFAPIL